MKNISLDSPLNVNNIYYKEFMSNALVVKLLAIIYTMVLAFPPRFLHCPVGYHNSTKDYLKIIKNTQLRSQFNFKTQTLYKLHVKCHSGRDIGSSLHIVLGISVGK